MGVEVLWGGEATRQPDGTVANGVSRLNDLHYESGIECLEDRVIMCACSPVSALGSRRAEPKEATEMSPHDASVPLCLLGNALAFRFPQIAPESATIRHRSAASSVPSSLTNTRHVRSRPPPGMCASSLMRSGRSPRLHHREPCIRSRGLWQGCCRPLSTAAGASAAEVDVEIDVGGSSRQAEELGPGRGSAVVAPAGVDKAPSRVQAEGGRKAINGASGNGSSANASTVFKPEQQLDAGSMSADSADVANGGAGAALAGASAVATGTVGGRAAATRGRPAGPRPPTTDATAVAPRRLNRAKTPNNGTPEAAIWKRERWMASRASALMRRMTEAGQQGRLVSPLCSGIGCGVTIITSMADNVHRSQYEYSACVAALFMKRGRRSACLYVLRPEPVV